MIDLRSDTVTKPCQGMRDAMAKASVGDDVWGDDPTVQALEALAAEMLGMEAALYLCSGTQSNLVAIMGYCQRGDEYIVGQDAHTYKYEAGGAAVLGSVQPQPIPVQADGTLALDAIRAVIKPDDIHFAMTRLLCLENTISGRVLPMTYVAAAEALARQEGLAFHLDGARIFNASVKLGIDVREISSHFDSVSVCLSKGLGAPVGSVLCGSRELIEKARRHRKILGGGMRQAGIIAAGGIYALQHNIDRLAEDHEHAALLGRELMNVAELEVDEGKLQTNMVFVTPRDGNTMALGDHLARQGILVDYRRTIRMVTHLHVGRRDVMAVVEAVKQFYH
jgi:threonine aldolase